MTTPIPVLGFAGPDDQTQSVSTGGDDGKRRTSLMDDRTNNAAGVVTTSETEITSSASISCQPIARGSVLGEGVGMSDEHESPLGAIAGSGWSLSAVSSLNEASLDSEKVPSLLLNMPPCCAEPPFQQATPYDWCASLLCMKCGNVKYYCIMCSSGRTYDDLKAAERHGRRKHMTVHAADTSIHDSSEDTVQRGRKGMDSLVDKYVECAGSQSKKFYANNQDGNGVNFLVNLASHGLSGPSPKLRFDEIRYHLLLCLLCSALSRGKREILAEILQLTHKFLTEPQSVIDSEGEESWCLPQKIPTTSNDLRNMYIEGKNAISSNIPRPVVVSLDAIDHHAYISVIDIVADVLARFHQLTTSLRLQTLRNKRSNKGESVASIIDSVRFQSILERAALRCKTDNPVVLWATVWSDDHEPNNLLQNRGSVHLQTITIACDPSNVDPTLSDSRSRTYPVSISAKGSNHEEFEREFSEELKHLSRDNSAAGHVFVWNPTTTAYDEVYLEVFVSLQDQPERRSANHLLGGNSQFHARWQWSCDVGYIAKHLPACDVCLSVLLSNKDPSSVCVNCLCFSFDRVESVMVEYPAPKGYPADYNPNKNGMLKPFRLTYEKMKAAVKLARDKVETGGWSVSAATAYLKSYCLNDNVIDELLTKANYRCQLAAADLSNLNRTGAREAADYQTQLLRDIAKKYPEMLDDSPYPGSWEGPISLEQRIDVIMHLLFLGVTKSTAFLVRDWTKMKERGSAFSKYVKDTLQLIPNIPWCTTAAYTGEKLGGWISENYMALARLSKWFYEQLNFVITEFIYVPPNQPTRNWRVTDCHQWFKNHGIKISNVLDDDINLPEDVLSHVRALQDGNKPLTRATVANMRIIIDCYLNSAGGTPTLVSTRVPSVDQIIKLVCSLHVMVSAIMSPTTSTEHASMTERCIKMFLSIYSRIERSMRLADDPSSKRKPDWVTQYNFTSLLNLPDIMREFGPLRNLWEGGEMGEKFIRRSKDALSNGLRGNWEVVTATKILTGQSIRNLSDACVRIDAGAITKSTTSILDGIRYEAKIYKNQRDVADFMWKCHPISALVCEQNDSLCTEVFVAVYDSTDYSEVVLVQLSMAGFDCSDGCHHYYWWSISECISSDVAMNMLRDTRMVGAIMLPKMKSDSDRELKEQQASKGQSPMAPQSYTVLLSDWREIDSGGCLTSPILQFTSFP